MELSVNEYQRRSFVRPLPEIFESIDILSRQAIMLRRQFWHVRNIINFLLHTEKDKEDVKYVEMVYDDITQLIDFVESYEGTINSIRELYVAKVSLQINETMRVLTIFTAILLPLALIAGIYGMNGIDLENITQSTLGLLSSIGNYGNNSNWICFVFYQERMDSSWKRQVEAKSKVLIIYLSVLLNAIDCNVLYIGFGYLMANYWQALGYPELN